MGVSGALTPDQFLVSKKQAQGGQLMDWLLHQNSFFGAIWLPLVKWLQSSFLGYITNKYANNLPCYTIYTAGLKLRMGFWKTHFFFSGLIFSAGSTPPGVMLMKLCQSISKACQNPVNMHKKWTSNGVKKLKTLLYTFITFCNHFAKLKFQDCAHSAKRWVAKSNLEWGHMMSHGIIDFCLYFQGRVIFFFTPKTLKKSPARDFFVGQNGKSMKILEWGDPEN